MSTLTIIAFAIFAGVSVAYVFRMVDRTRGDATAPRTWRRTQILIGPDARLYAASKPPAWTDSEANELFVDIAAGRASGYYFVHVRPRHFTWIEVLPRIVRRPMSPAKEGFGLVVHPELKKGERITPGQWRELKTSKAGL